MRWNSGTGDYNTSDPQATATRTRHTIDGLPAGTEYTVRVRATNGADAGTPREPAAVNSPPTATNDSATTDEDTPVTIDVLANDIDADTGDTPFVVAGSVTHPSHGTATLNADRTVAGLTACTECTVQGGLITTCIELS